MALLSLPMRSDYNLHLRYVSLTLNDGYFLLELVWRDGYINVR